MSLRKVNAIHQMLPSFLSRDAIGNQAFRMREILRKWGIDSQIYAQDRDPQWADSGIDYRRYRGDQNNLLILHHALGSDVSDFAAQLPDQLVFYYHNITPSEYLRGYNPSMADMADRGRKQLELYKNRPFALAGSEYNRMELLSAGFNDVGTMPYFIYVDELLEAAESDAGRRIADRYRDGWVNILFVGRIVPNKKQDDLIRAFGYYHKLVNPKSRLIMVGSEVCAPGYRWELETTAELLGLGRHVHMPGSVELQELGGYYRAASVFLCMSEHEGFCVPLLEAMAFDIPVLAFKATGVPDALGDSGVLLTRKNCDVVGEMLGLLVSDQRLRTQIVAGQRRRLESYTHIDIAAQFRQCIQHILAEPEEKTG